MPTAGCFIPPHPIPLPTGEGKKRSNGHLLDIAILKYLLSLSAGGRGEGKRNIRSFPGCCHFQKISPLPTGEGKKRSNGHLLDIAILKYLLSLSAGGRGEGKRNIRSFPGCCHFQKMSPLPTG